jgi:hypothetical protein
MIARPQGSRKAPYACNRKVGVVSLGRGPCGRKPLTSVLSIIALTDTRLNPSVDAEKWRKHWDLVAYATLQPQLTSARKQYRQGLLGDGCLSLRSGRIIRPTRVPASDKEWPTMRPVSSEDCRRCGVYLDGPQACGACIKWQIAWQRQRHAELKALKQPRHRPFLVLRGPPALWPQAPVGPPPYPAMLSLWRKAPPDAYPPTGD